MLKPIIAKLNDKQKALLTKRAFFSPKEQKKYQMEQNCMKRWLDQYMI